MDDQGIGDGAAAARAGHTSGDHVSADLVEKARAGDRHAFDALLVPMIKPAYSLAYTMLGHRQEAEDAVQEAAIKAWNNLRRLRKTSSVRAWFLAIVANECRMSRRRPWFSVVKLADLDRAPGRNEQDALDAADLRLAVVGLAPAERLALFLHFGLDLTVDEMAVVLGVTPAAARSRLYRAVRRLRPALEAQGC